MGLQANRSGGDGAPAGQASRFVLLRHECEDGHWDLMIEVPGEEKLRTWQIRTTPGEWGRRVTALRIADHRKVYLSYEGEISGGRGQVQKVDEGSAEIVTTEPEVRLRLAGRVVRGEFVIAGEPG